MIEQERFKLVSGIKLGTHSGIWDSRKQHNQGIGDELWLGEVVDLLNQLHEENIKLKTANQRWEKICCEGLQINNNLRKKIIKNEELDKYGKSL